MDSTLYNAAVKGNTSDGEFLLAEYLKRDEEIGYQVTPKGNTVLHVASFYGHSHFVGEVLEITPALLCYKNKKNETALHLAAAIKGHKRVVRVLLHAAGEENKETLMRMTDDNGDTALHKAARSGNFGAVKVLVKEDSELFNFQFPANNAEETPLYLAAESDFADCASQILKSSIRPTYGGPCGRTALHAATIQRNRRLRKVVSEMLGWNKSLAYLPAGSENDWTTTIHIAASEGYVNVIKELLNHCPDCWELLNSNGQNALHVAISNKKRREKLSFQRRLRQFRRGRRDFEIKRKNMHEPEDEMDSGGTNTQQRENKAKRDKIGKLKDIMTATQIHLVVATLLVTVTFAAALTLPGGFESDPDSHNKGMAMLIRKTVFRAFVVSNAIAFTCSSSAVFSYFFIAVNAASTKKLKTIRRLLRRRVGFRLSRCQPL
ncbi:ankyrin repeat-containing protein ITN1-like [Lycium ferocissimum]|uniref:ankyrin repeat-containing protein ITN1-like n=1 Tax=Lycium ferocissimum TaxID=112874 RepID=UPI0028150853|nr:ankyrin repeat-containing protein ITN1-like [Lycium ferocissimum]